MGFLLLDFFAGEEALVGAVLGESAALDVLGSDEGVVAGVERDIGQEFGKMLLQTDGELVLLGEAFSLEDLGGEHIGCWVF